MKTAVICFYEAYPPISGAASVTYYTAKNLSGAKILIQLSHRDKREIINGDCAVINIEATGENRWKKLFGIGRVIKKISDQIIEFDPSIIILEGASWVVYLWLLICAIKKRNIKTKIVYHAHNVEYLLRKEKHNRFIVSVTRWAENKILRSVDVSFAVSDVDRRQFEKLYSATSRVLPNGVDIEKFDGVTEDEIKSARKKYNIDENTILFMGLYFYTPNREAVDFLLSSVMPCVIEQCPNARLAIIGGEIPYKAPWLINPGVIDHHELPVFVKACGIGVAPIFSGSGTRLKILEYMAAGLPVLSTSKGAEGLNVKNGFDIVLADNSSDFSSALIKLLKSDELRLIGLTGRQLVEAHYSWQVIMEKCNNELQRMIGLKNGPTS